MNSAGVGFTSRGLVSRAVRLQTVFTKVAFRPRRSRVEIRRKYHPKTNLTFHDLIYHIDISSWLFAINDMESEKVIRIQARLHPRILFAKAEREFDLKSSVVFVDGVSKLDMFSSLEQSTDARFVVEADVVADKRSVDAIPATLFLVKQQARCWKHMSC